MTWKEDKKRIEKNARKKADEKQLVRDLHDAFWGRLKQPKEKENGNRLQPDA